MSKHHILIVDDEEDIRLTLEAALQAEGYKTSLAASGEEALNAIKENRPNLVLLDVMMPDLDGYEVCRRIKADNETRNIAVVFASAMKKTQHKIEGLDMGADDYITKPFNMPELLAKLRALFRIQESQWRLEKLLDFAHTINIIELSAITGTISNKLRGFITADRFSIFIKDDETGSLKALVHNHEGVVLDEMTGESPYSRIMAKAMETGKRVMVSNFTGSEYDTGAGRVKYEDGFALCVPLTAGSETFGVLNLNGNNRGFFTQPDFTTIELTAEIISAALNIALRVKQLKTLAVTDGLTKLYNHKHFHEVIQMEFERAARYKQPLSLLMIDIDHFKNVNDSYGHLVGDDILSKLSTLFMGHIRKTDIASRYGGEEFAILLPQTSGDKALILAERIRADVENTLFETEIGNLKLTVSLGICDSMQSGMETAIDLINNADEALYRAKDAGRNQIKISAIESETA